VSGRAVILFDDLISTGTTLCRAAAKCREAGASRVFAAATHGLFIDDALRVLGAAGFDGIVVGDTVRSEVEGIGLLPKNVTVLDTSHLACEAIALTHAGL
jgi:ribose-phosphate pyrophosphokinase